MLFKSRAKLPYFDLVKLSVHKCATHKADLFICISAYKNGHFSLKLLWRICAAVKVLAESNVKSAIKNSVGISDQFNDYRLRGTVIQS